jgi:hypothetical protein
VSVTVKRTFRLAPIKGRHRVDDSDPTLRESVPRIARLMAIAIVIDEMVRAGETTYAEVARAAGVSRTRVSQVMRLLDLPPKVQTDAVSRDPLNANVPEPTQLPVVALHLA